MQLKYTKHIEKWKKPKPKRPQTIMAIFCITKSKAQIFGCCWRREVCSQITKITAKVIPYTDNVAIESYKNHSFLCLSSFRFCSSFSLPEGGNIGHDTKEIIAYGAKDKRKSARFFVSRSIHLVMIVCMIIITKIGITAYWRRYEDISTNENVRNVVDMKIIGIIMFSFHLSPSYIYRAA